MKREVWALELAKRWGEKKKEEKLENVTAIMTDKNE